MSASARNRLWPLGGVGLGLVLASWWLAPRSAHAPQRVSETSPVCVFPTPDEAYTSTVEERLAPQVLRVIPEKPADWQKKPPCDAAMDEHAIRGACYGRASKKPPCEKLIEYEGACYRAVAKAKESPVSLEPK